MPTLTVLMGPPGAGKTTWTEANLAPGQVLCSTERLRHDRRMHDRPGALVRYLAQLRVKAEDALRAGRSVLVDGCNTRKGDRSTWLALARDCGAQTELVVFDTPLAVVLAVQAARAAPVAEAKVREYHAQHQAALRVIGREGWRRVIHVRRGAPRPRRVSSW